VTRLTDNDAEDECPAWAPDGQSLLISSNRDGDFDLWIVPLDAPDQAENLIDDASVPRRDEMPSWYVAAP
jgi:Tol biopolymer transport system component